MPQLEHFSAAASVEQISVAMQRDGACIIDQLVETEAVDKVLAELSPYMDLSQLGRDDFTGRQTERTGALIARSPASHDFVVDPLVLAAANAFLQDYCPRIQLHLTQTIRILPGQGTQAFHRDREAWSKYLPPQIEPQFNTIWAMTDFSEENGAIWALSQRSSIS